MTIPIHTSIKTISDEKSRKDYIYLNERFWIHFAGAYEEWAKRVLEVL